jgi:hypothetical protein
MFFVVKGIYIYELNNWPVYFLPDSELLEIVIKVELY